MASYSMIRQAFAGTAKNACHSLSHNFKEDSMKRVFAVLLLLSATACDPYYSRGDRDDRRHDNRQEQNDRRSRDEHRSGDSDRNPGGYR